MSVSLSTSKSPGKISLTEPDWRREANGLMVRTALPTNVYSTYVKKVFNRLTGIAYRDHLPTRSLKDRVKIGALGAVSYVSVGLFLPISIPGAIQKGSQVVAGAAQKASQVFKQRFHHVA